MRKSGRHDFLSTRRYFKGQRSHCMVQPPSGEHKQLSQYSLSVSDNSSSYLPIKIGTAYNRQSHWTCTALIHALKQYYFIFKSQLSCLFRQLRICHYSRFCSTVMFLCSNHFLNTAISQFGTILLALEYPQPSLLSDPKRMDGGSLCSCHRRL